MVRSVWAGWCLGFLAVGAPSSLLAQGAVPVTRIELKENYPNPVDSSTTIPFDVFTEGCNRGQKPKVTLKIYNVLVQAVATPELMQGGSRDRVDDLRLPCGEYRAVWDGKVRGKPAVSGVYYYQLSVDDKHTYTRKLIVRRGLPASRE